MSAVIRHGHAVRRIESSLLLVGVLVAGGCGRGPFWKFPELDVARCSAVDFLFVIDNSESMEHHQANLRASFEPFIDGIESTLDDVDDFQVGVVTTDAYRYNPDPCRQLGALVTSTPGGGPGFDPVGCGPFVEGERYMTQEDDLAAAFNCTANVGTEGSRDEEPMKAMQRVLQSQYGGWWRECNGGFIRDEALLVNVIITDESDGEFTPGSTRPVSTPDDWFGSIEDAKGTEENAVVVSLLNGVTPDCPIVDPAFDGANIAEFTRKFTHGFVGGICEPDYGDIFARAVEEIDQACTEFHVEYGPRP